MIGVTRHGLGWEEVEEDPILILSRPAQAHLRAARIYDYEEEFKSASASQMSV